MPLEIMESMGSYVVSETNVLKRKEVLDLYSYLISNILSGNSLNSFSIEIRGGRLKVKALDDMVISVSGFGYIEANKKIINGWRAFFVKRDGIVSVKTFKDSVAYVGISGGIKKNKKKLYENDIIDEGYYPLEDIIKELPARFIPEHLVPKRTFNKIEIYSTLKVFPKKFRGIIKKNLERRRHILVPFLRSNQDFSFQINQDVIGIPVSYLGDYISISFDHSPKENYIGALNSKSFDDLSRAPQNSYINIVIKNDPLYKSVEDSLKYSRQISRIRDIIERAIEAVKRGAKALKMMVNGKVYIAWIEEIA